MSGAYVTDVTQLLIFVREKQATVQAETFSQVRNVSYVSKYPPPEAVAFTGAPGRCVPTYSGLVKQSPLMGTQSV